MSAPTVEAPIWITPEDLPLYQADAPANSAPMPEYSPFSDTPMFAALAETYAPDFDVNSFLSTAAKEAIAHEKAERHADEGHRGTLEINRTLSYATPESQDDLQDTDCGRVTGTLDGCLPRDKIASTTQQQPLPQLESQRGGSTLVTLAFEEISPWLSHSTAEADRRYNDDSTVVLPRFSGSTRLSISQQRQSAYTGTIPVTPRREQTGSFRHTGDLLRTA